jgi:hypothetical protein
MRTVGIRNPEKRVILNTEYDFTANIVDSFIVIVMLYLFKHLNS